ncbi:MAG: CotH kinase family protein, partial [Verrucomicrobiota bacterium]
APERNALSAEEGVDLVVSVQILPNGAPIESVTLKQRVMFKNETSAPLRDDGVAPDETAGDGRYTGMIAANWLFGTRFKAGEMLRWAFIARDRDGHEARLPHLKENTVAQPEYFGTLVEDPSIESALPVLHWFSESPDQAIRPTGSRASAYFDGQFYDNVFVKRRGQSGAIGWPKPKLKFDFNPQDHFRYDPSRRRVEEFNLQSHFTDPSFMRENVAFGFFNEIGTPASDTRHWHIRLNGAYYGLFSYVEQVDQDFLRQQGLDPDGSLYKANGFPSTLAVLSTEAQYRSLYQKDTNKDEPYDDFIAFVEGINGGDRFDYIKDHVNLPALVNSMAGQSILRNHDRLTKNYYLYRDRV